MLKCYLAVRAERRAGARGCWVAGMPFCVPPVRFRSRLHLLSFHVPAPAVHPQRGLLAPAPLRTDCHLYYTRLWSLVLGRFTKINKVNAVEPLEALPELVVQNCAQSTPCSRARHRATHHRRRKASK